MRKNFTLLFLIGIFGLFTTNLFAQQDATIDPADIRYWIGEGENEAVFIVNWNNPDTALAWGYRFSGDVVMLKDMMLDIQSVDSRFGFEGESYVTDITFNDGFLDLRLAGMYWMSIKNGEMCMNYFDAEPVHNGDYVKWGDESCGILLDPVNYVYIWEKEVAAVYPNAEEAMIDPSQIVYWIGEGENEAVFAVNWADPDICYAWGYRFSTPDVTVKTIMDAIAEADGRFDYEVGAWGVTDITFNDGELNLGVMEYSYFMYNVNGEYAWYGYDEQTVMNGDFVKFGDVACGTEIAQWTYVWETTVQPVPVYNTVAENMNGSVSVYPNPASETLYVNAENVERVELYDMTGRNVLNTTSTVVDLRGFEAGIYFVTVKTANAIKTTKLVVK